MITKEQIVGLFNLHNVSFRGDEIICSCPFPVHEHGDRNPSFGINMSKGVYNCFSCHESGNLVQLCERLLGMNRMDAMSEIYSDMTLAEAFRRFSFRTANRIHPCRLLVQRQRLEQDALIAA